MVNKTSHNITPPPKISSCCSFSLVHVCIVRVVAGLINQTMLISSCCSLHLVHVYIVRVFAGLIYDTMLISSSCSLSLVHVCIVRVVAGLINQTMLISSCCSLSLVHVCIVSVVAGLINETMITWYYAKLYVSYLFLLNKMQVEHIIGRQSEGKVGSETFRHVRQVELVGVPSDGQRD